MQTPVDVKILGRTYTLRVKKENAARTRRVAQQVDGRMRAFQRQHPEQAKLTTAIITALALAEDLALEREGHSAAQEGLGEELRALTETLTGALSASEDAAVAPGDDDAAAEQAEEEAQASDREEEGGASAETRKAEAERGTIPPEKGFQNERHGDTEAV